MTIANMLKGHELFKSLTVEEVRQISDFSATKHFSRGESVFREHDRASHIFLVLEGQVSLRLPAGPEELSIVIARLEAGDLLGLSPLLGSDRYTTSAYCNWDSDVLAIDARQMRDLLKHNKVAGFDIMRNVARIYFARHLEVMRRLQDVVNQLPLIR